MTLNTKSPVDHCAFNYLSWKAVVAGALIAIGLTFLFNLLTLGLGLTTFVANRDGQEVLAFAAFGWLFVGGFIMLFLAGWSAGKLVSRANASHSMCHGMMHGFVTWSLYLLVSLTMLSSIMPNAVSNTGSLTSPFSQTTADHETGHSLEATSMSHPNRLSPAQKEVAEERIHSMGLVTLASFFLVLAGALGCSFGAYVGMSDKRCRSGEMK